MLKKSVSNANVDNDKDECMCGKWKVSALENRIMISINGTTIIDLLDRSMSERLSRGSVGLYAEDPEVSFDDTILINLAKT